MSHLPRPLVLLACLAADPTLAQSALTMESRVAGLEIVALTELPAAPAERGDRETCSHKLVQPETTAGRLVADKGWAVTREAAFHGLTAVTFAGGFIPGTSGTCAFVDGNLAFYDGDRLVALAYANDPEKIVLGFVSPLGDGGLRLWSGDYLEWPLADVQPREDGIAIVPLAFSEAVCGGAAEVPLIYGLPIDKARRALRAAGWEPVPYAEARSEYGGQASDIAAAGVTEVEECSGTGLGYCSYVYRSAAGQLFVTSVGEISEDGTLPVLADYSVDCQ